MTQFCEDDAVPQHLLQLSGSRELLPQTRFHPPEKRRTIPQQLRGSRRVGECVSSPLGLLQPAQVLIGLILDPLFVHLFGCQTLDCKRERSC